MIIIIVNLNNGMEEQQTQETTQTPSTGISKDWLIAAGGAAGFFGLLKLAGWIDSNFDISQVYNLVDFYIIAAKVAIASALVWTLKKFVFSNTLGKDFGDTFNNGWAGMSNVEKTRWMIGFFLAVFATIMFAF